MSSELAPPSYDPGRTLEFRRLAQAKLPQYLKPPKEDPNDEFEYSVNDLFADAMLGIYLDHTEQKYGLNSRQYQVASTLVSHAVDYLSGEPKEHIKQRYEKDLRLLPLLPAWKDSALKASWKIPQTAAIFMAYEPEFALSHCDPGAYIKEQYTSRRLQKPIAEGLLLIFGYSPGNLPKEAAQESRRRAIGSLRTHILVAQNNKKWLTKIQNDKTEMLGGGFTILKRLAGSQEGAIPPEAIGRIIEDIAHKKDLSPAGARQYVFGYSLAALDELLSFNH